MARIDRTRELARFDRRGIAGMDDRDMPFVGQVVNLGHFSPYAGRYVEVNPVAIDGDEVEGAVPTLTPDSRRTIAVDILRGAPALGDSLICHHEGNRWVAEKDGAGGQPVPPSIVLAACQCPVPATLKVTGPSDSTCPPLIFTCTLAYRATPPAYADLGLGAMIFLSNETFHDTNANADYRFYFYCQNNQFAMTRLYAAYPDGAGGTTSFRDALLYSWILGGAGNSCTPFSLHGGKPYYQTTGATTCPVMVDPA